MHNFKPGQVYCNQNGNQRREVLFVTDRHILTRNESSTIESLWDKKYIKDWVLAPQVKKLYVSVWKNDIRTWTISTLDMVNYAQVQVHYKDLGYKMLKEYVLEYEDKDEVR